MPLEQLELKNINVLSCFDGISCGQIALERAKIKVGKYYASEIYKPAITVTQRNYPTTIQLGDVRNVNLDDIDNIKLLCGGSPCQDISGLNKKKENKGLKGIKSRLFYEFLRIREQLNKDAYYLLENVQGTDTEVISRELKRKPIKLNSKLVSAQSRDRLYWTNIPVNSMPHKKVFYLSDILEDKVDDTFYQSDAWNLWWIANKDFQLEKQYSTLNAQRAGCLTARQYASWNGNFIQDQRGIRRLTPIECERLQTLPDDYTLGIRESERYKVIGDCWTIDIIVHILKHMK